MSHDMYNITINGKFREVVTTVTEVYIGYRKHASSDLVHINGMKLEQFLQDNGNKIRQQMLGR